MVLDFIKKNELAVISYLSSEGRPSSAVIGFGETDNLELIFGTYADSRKYQAIKKDGRVSFVIGWDEAITVQYEGLAEELSKSNYSEYTAAYFAKNPKAREYESDPREKYFRVTPLWVRYSEIKSNPWKIIEFNF